MLAVALFCCLAFTAQRAVASSLALYSDSNCTRSNVLENVAALDGYPDGECTHISDLNGGSDSYSSLMFLTLDAGCAITLYGEDSVVCSGFAFLASLNVCYNTSWTYYSVDGCTAPSISSSSSSLSSGAIAGIAIVAIAAAAGVAVAGLFFLGRRQRRRASEVVAARTKRREQIEEDKADEESADGWQHGSGGALRQFGTLGMTSLPQRTVPYPLHEVGGQERVEVDGQSDFLRELPERPFQH